MASHSKGRHKQTTLYLSPQLKSKLRSIAHEDESLNGVIKRACNFLYSEKAEEVLRKKKRDEQVAVELEESARRSEKRINRWRMSQ